MSERTIDAPCLVCGCDRAVVRFRMRDGAFQVIVCPVCGLGRTWPPVPVDEIHRYYPVAYYGEENQRFLPLLERVVRWFRDRRARRLHRSMKPGRVLDVGCGRGHFLNWLRQHGWEAAGVELSQGAAHHAREVLGLDVYVGDFLSMPYASNTYDVVVFWHVLEHMTDVRAAIVRANELLRDGGLLIVAVPNFSSVQSTATGRDWFHLDIPRHYFHFSSKGLRRLLENHGFEVQRMDHLSLEQNIYGWLQSLYNRMGFRHNLLYDLIKNRSARDSAMVQRPPWAQIIAVVLLLPLFVPASVLLSVLEAIWRRGGTIETYARKVAPSK